MKQRFFFALILVLLCMPGRADNPQWQQDAETVGESLQTLEPLLGPKGFISNISGLDIIVANKVDEVIDNLNTFAATLQSEMGALDAEAQADALDTFAQLLLEAADDGERLNNRELYNVSLTLATHYNVSYAVYNQLASQYNLSGYILPIGIILADRGGWSVPG
jgi:hypothetical protein